MPSTHASRKSKWRWVISHGYMSHVTYVGVGTCITDVARCVSVVVCLFWCVCCCVCVVECHDALTCCVYEALSVSLVVCHGALNI